MITYREARIDDAGPIAALHADSWRRTYRGMYADDYLDGDLVGERLDVWNERLVRPPDGQYTLLALENGELAGFTCTYGAEDETWGSYIDNLHVGHRFRRRGIASALMAQTGEWLEPRHPGGVYLWVLEGNEGARRFYERLGASNAETVEMEVHPGGRASSCRYTWPGPDALGGMNR